MIEALFYGVSLDSNIILFLLFIAIVAGTIDAIAGGGGLITVPALLISGISPLTALGTNRLQAVIGEATSFATYILYRKLPIESLGLGVIATATGAVIGSYAVSMVPERNLEILLPILMVAITIYSVFSNKMKTNTSSAAKLSLRTFMIAGGLVIGFYNGFFGPGTGSIWMVALVIMLGRTIKQASIATKPLNLVGNLISLLFFASMGYVNYQIGLLMGLGQIIGSIIGSKMVISRGDTIVRPIFIMVCVFITIKVILDSLNMSLFV